MGKHVGDSMRVLAVLGPWRGGTSLVTGILNAFGAYVGNEFVDAQTGYCTYEDLRLREAVLSGFDERAGAWFYRGTPAQRIASLSGWMDLARTEAASFGCRAIAAKHPILCKQVDELYQAWSASDGLDLTVVSVQRSASAVHRSWTRPLNATGRHWWPRWDRIYAVDDLINSRDECLANRPHIQIDFEQLRRAPERTLTQFAEDCQLPLDRLDDAIAMVRQP
jgi:hypothetical protein